MAEFATLGAYELTAPDGDTVRADRARWKAALGGEAPTYAHSLAEASGARDVVATSSEALAVRGRLTRESPPKRVLLFAKVAPASCRQRPVEGQALPCGAVGTARGRRGADERLPRRGGSVQAPEQPCTWTGFS
jgi:hypothetical protein